MITFARSFTLLSLLLTGAIFGFFYAWVCSTMWGLDIADPRVALDAMKAMNATVRNVVFFPAFFLAPVALLVTARLWFVLGRKCASFWFAAGGIVYLLFGLALTLTINVPMNEALAAMETPADRDAAQSMWDAYSQPWQFWNQMRTVASGIALLLAGMGMLMIDRGDTSKA